MLGDRLGQPLSVWHLFSYELLLCALKYSINRPNETPPQNRYHSKNPITLWHKVVFFLNQVKENKLLWSDALVKLSMNQKKSNT